MSALLTALNPGDLVVPFLLLAFLLLVILTLRLRRGRLVVRLRPLHGARMLQMLTGRAVEEGRMVHLTLGTGRLGEATAAETLMGLAALDWLAGQASRANTGPLVTSADPAAALVAQDQLRVGAAQACTERSRSKGWQALDRARFIAPDPAAYGAGTRALMAREAQHLNTLLGHFGDEYLLLAAEHPAGAAPISAPVVAGSARLETLPQIALTAEHSFLGEELFAVGAYLACWPSHLAALLLQDTARVVIVVVILVGALLRTVGG